jgi:hypothetical protein
MSDTQIATPLNQADWVDAVNELLAQSKYDGLGVDEAASLWERELTPEQAFNEAAESRDIRSAERHAEELRQYGPSLFWNGRG